MWVGPDCGDINPGDFARTRVAFEKLRDAGIGLHHFEDDIHFAGNSKAKLFGQLLKRGNFLCLRVELGGRHRDLEKGVEKALQCLLFFRTFEDVVQKIRYDHGTARLNVRLEVLDNPRLRIRLLKQHG